MSTDRRETLVSSQGAESDALERSCAEKRLIADIYARLKGACPDLPSIRSCLFEVEAFEKAVKVWEEGGFSLAEGETPCGLDEENGIVKLRESARRREIMGTKRLALIGDRKICDMSTDDFETFSQISVRHLEVFLDLFDTTHFSDLCVAKYYARCTEGHLSMIENNRAFSSKMFKKPELMKAFADFSPGHLDAIKEASLTSRFMKNLKAMVALAECPGSGVKIYFKTLEKIDRCFRIGDPLI